MIHRHRMPLLSIAAALLAAPAVHAEPCRDALLEVNRLSTGISTTSGDRRTLRTLSEAALLLGEARRDDLCEEVVGEMRELLEARREAVAAAAARERRLAALAAATPLPQLEQPLDATASLPGLVVVNLDDQELGTVERVMVAPDRGAVVYVVVDRGGFLGLLDDEVAVPWSALRLTADRQTAVLPVSPATMDAAPALGELSEDAAPDVSWLE